MVQETPPIAIVHETTPHAVPLQSTLSHLDALTISTQEEEKLVEQLRNEEEPVEEFVLSPDDPGVVATALYDYQAAAADEISFDPEDVITHIEMVLKLY